MTLPHDQHDTPDQDLHNKNDSDHGETDDNNDPILDHLRWDAPPLPSDADIIDFVTNSSTHMTKKDIARHFQIKGANRTAFKVALRRLEHTGQLAIQTKPIRPAIQLPPVTVLSVIGIDEHGDLKAIPIKNHEGQSKGKEQDEPIIYISGTKGATSHKRSTNKVATVGDRVLARLKKVENNIYEASVIRILATQQDASIVGVYNQDESGTFIIPTDKKDRNLYTVIESDTLNPKHGDIVIALPSKQKARYYTPKQARIREIIGDMKDPRAFSLIAIHKNNIPLSFDDEVLVETESMTVPPLGKRVDLRHIPLVTIDGADARDFDDAVFAEPWVSDKHGENSQKGWHLMVAIADVTHYVTPDSALDKSAKNRGNSVYFPDRVIPMLPEKLCNDLCSLRPHEDRACLAVHMWIDNNGKLQKYRFIRGLMQSHARLTYEQVQQAIDNDGHLQTETDNPAIPLLDMVIKPLYRAYECLLKTREKRGTLDLDVPERLVVLDKKQGKIASITPRVRLDSHKLIEEFMILANVASALALEAKKSPAIYRIHEPPTPEKLEMLQGGLSSMGFNLAMGNKITPRLFTGLLHQAEQDGKLQIVSDLVLRSQCRAIYSHDNKGHFGLALAKYCHFTSPIRRYADVLVHRSLVSAWNLSDNIKRDGLPYAQSQQFSDISDHISMTEQRAVQAEREAMNRYISAYMVDQIDATFTARITGITTAGLFINLDKTGADGLIPLSSLPGNDYYIFDKNARSLVGEKTGILFTLGQRIHATLKEVNIASGIMAFTIDMDATEITHSQTIPKRKRGKPHYGRNHGGKNNHHYKSISKKDKTSKKKKKTTPKHKRRNLKK